MTNRLMTLPTADLAPMLAPYFNDFPTADDFDAYLSIARPDLTDTRARLIDALDNDLADLLHNCNLADALPDADDLTDDEFDALADRILAADDILPAIADIILASLR